MFSRRLSTKISASELRRKFIKSALLVGFSLSHTHTLVMMKQMEGRGFNKIGREREREREQKGLKEKQTIFLEEFSWVDVTPIFSLG